MCYASDAGGARAGSGSHSIYVSAYHYICVRMLLYACPHATIYYYKCVRMLLCLCPHATIYVSSYYYVCVLIIPHMCPHTTIYVLIVLYMLDQTFAVERQRDQVLLLHIGQHTTIYTTYASYCHICVLIIPRMRPHTTIYVSSYNDMCPHTIIYVPSYY